MKVEEGKNQFYSALPLLRKARELGFSSVEDLQKLAVVRGLRYYDSLNQGPEWKQQKKFQITSEQFPNAELAIALSPDLPTDDGSAAQVRQRIASAVLSAEDVDPLQLAEMANAEKCEAIVRWIANCGREVEPQNSFWDRLLEELPEVEKPERAPHPTRFFAMTGIVAGKKEIVKQWIRLKRSPDAFDRAKPIVLSFAAEFD